jgi:ABC-type Mn2+/Zn2+ transport system ATPase subunit
MTAVIETTGLGKRYRRVWALADCTLSIPAGHVVGLVGPNGAGKTTLLSLAAGLMAPTTGTIEVLGGPPPASPAQLARVGSWPRTHRSTPACPSPITWLWARTSIRAGTRSWPAAGSTGWTWTRARRPGGCPAGSAPSSR